MNEDPRLQKILAHQLYLMQIKSNVHNDITRKIIQNQISNTDKYLTAYVKQKKKTGVFI